MSITAEEFNNKIQKGSNVIYTDDFGNEIETRTRSEAWELGHGDAVVMIEGKSGGHDVERIKLK